MSIAIYHGFTHIHFEMLGYIIEYCIKFNNDFKIFSIDYAIGKDWKNHYEKIFMKELDFYSPCHFSPTEHKLIILLTDDDKSFREEWILMYSNKILCVEHCGILRRENLLYRMGTRKFNLRPNLPWSLPVYYGISKHDKLQSLSSTINIVCIGFQNRPPNIKFLENLIDNLNNVIISVISRNIEVKFPHHSNIKIFENCSTEEMFNILKKAHYVLCIDYPPNNLPIANSTTAAIPIAFSYGCRLIIPYIWQYYYNFSSAISYKDSSIQKNGNDKLKLELLNNHQLDNIYSELDSLINHRDKTFNTFIDTINNETFKKSKISLKLITYIKSNNNFMLLLFKSSIINQLKKLLNSDYEIEWTIGIDNIITDEILKKIEDIKLYGIKFNIINNLEISNSQTLENINNKICNDANFVIWLNDNNYYFENFISSVILLLCQTNKIFVASQNIYIYDLYQNKFYKLTSQINYKFILGFKNHSNNDINYLNNINNYELTSSDNLFINFSYPDNININYDLLKQYFENSLYSYKLDENIIDHFIKNDHFNEYKLQYKTFKFANLDYIPLNNPINNIDYDIIYLIGNHGIVWDPKDKNLGGSEQAIVFLSTEWAKNGYRVAIYGNFYQDSIYNDVQYKSWSKFDSTKQYNIVILWRKIGLLTLVNYNLKYRISVIDFHDSFKFLEDLNNNIIEEAFNRATFLNVKSNYHLEGIKELLTLKNITYNYNYKCNIIPNGIRIDDFSKLNYKIERQPYRFCYCSSYDRGLQFILSFIWPKIYKEEPLAELHVYYGMNYIPDKGFENWKANIRYLLGTEGVIDHGRQPVSIIAREKFLSTFHLYFNDCIGEIDCINIKESLVAGCIPILSTFGVYKERDGFHIDLDCNESNASKIADIIVNLMRNTCQIAELQESLKKSKTIVSWNTIAMEWLKIMN